ncbi:MAG: hypothetical protein J2P18_22705 [Nocardia sp.]|nr:hypothetical protein [Nocardia sp.]
MPAMEIDPDVLRNQANEHDRVAGEIEEWGKPPLEWLADFQRTYGAIADPVRKSLYTYYHNRQTAADHLADQHRQTAEQLRAAANSYERSDDEGAAALRHASQGFQPGGSQSPTGAGFSDPAGHQSGTPVVNGAPAVGAGPGSGGPLAGTPLGGTDGTGATPASTQPGEPAQPESGATASPISSTPVDTPPSSVSASGAPSSPAAPGDVSAPQVAPAPGSGYSDGDAARPQAPSAADADPGMVPVMSPFAAAVAAARDKEAQPGVVADIVDQDLLVARTLLASVLGSVDVPMVGIHWAVAVLRGPAGAGVFITSTEGRGWLPAGLYLPREVSTPWAWDDMLDDGSGSVSSHWEGISDPARVLVEFGLAWGPKANAELVALASSAPIDGSLRTRFPNVATAGMVGPAYDADLRLHTPDTVDRLDLSGSEAAVEAAVVPDGQLRSRLVELAAEVHGHVVHTGPSTPDTVESRRIRDRILAVLEAGQPVSPQWWDELREADDLLMAAMAPRRVDVARVDPGDLRIDDEAAELRAMTFERRCNELLLLLAEDPTRQQLRDAAYAHDQVVHHPTFVQAPATTGAPSAERTDRPAAVPGQVSAPTGTVSAPPTGTSVPPVTPPPAVEPQSGQS